jgi:hypothetical protein
VPELRRRFGCIFPVSVVQSLVADDARVGCKEDDIFELRTAKNYEKHAFYTFQRIFLACYRCFRCVICQSGGTAYFWPLDPYIIRDCASLFAGSCSRNCLCTCKIPKIFQTTIICTYNGPLSKFPECDVHSCVPLHGYLHTE